MIEQQKNGLKYYQFSLFLKFSNCLYHGIFSGQNTKKNDSFSRFDINSQTEAIKNRTRLCSVFQDEFKLVSSKQIHGSRIRLVSPSRRVKFLGRRGLRPRDLRLADAMISQAPGKLLLIETADCQPILLFDPVTRSMAAIHSGWRGTVQNIIGKTIKAMQKHLKVNSKNLLAGVGPSLGPCCAEFIHRADEFPAAFQKYFLSNNRVDLWQISFDQLVTAGVQPKNIEPSQICTHCHHDEWFSYRWEKDKAGRFGSVIGLRKGFRY